MPTTTLYLSLTALAYAERIGRNITHLRAETGVTQKSILSALALNGCRVQKNSLTKVEQGHETPTLVEAVVIAHMLGVDLKELYA
jgi:DNA-binding XRE family transcriptional regulator